MRIKVVENTHNQLNVRMVPIAVPLLVAFGGLLVLCGPLVAWSLGYTTDLKLRNQELQITRALLGRYDVKEHRVAVKDIRSIDTQIYTSMGSTLDITIHTNSGDIRVPFEALDGDAKIAMASRLTEAIVQGKDYTESSGQNLPHLGFFLGAVMILLGICLLLLLQTSTIIVSRSESILRVRIRLWLIPVSRESCIDLTKFASVDFAEMGVNNPAGVSASSNSVFLQSKTGTKLPLAFGPMFTEDSTQEIMKIIKVWVKARPYSA